MSIVILILKIIGFLFLALLLLLALLLFHPLFYQLEGEWKEDAELRGYFWWLFQILRVEFAWEGGKLTIRFRLFGIAKEFGGGRELGGAGEEDTKASDAPKEKEPPRDLSQNAGQDAEMGQAAGSAPGSMKGQEMAGQEGALPDLEAFDEAAGPEDDGTPRVAPAHDMDSLDFFLWMEEEVDKEQARRQAEKAKQAKP